jgi:hypothetical protein
MLVSPVHSQCGSSSKTKGKQQGQEKSERSWREIPRVLYVVYDITYDIQECE